MRRPAMFGAAVILTFGASVARAEPPPPPGPQPAPPSGATCGMATSGPEGTYQSGVVWAGPLRPASGTGSMAVRCTIEVEGMEAASAQGEFGDPAVLAPSAVRFYAFPGWRVTLCTDFVYPNVTVRYDADPAQPGDQCAPANRVETSSGTAYTVVPSPAMDVYCLWIYPLNWRPCVPYPRDLPAPTQEDGMICMAFDPPVGKVCVLDPIMAVPSLGVVLTDLISKLPPVGSHLSAW